MSNKKNDALENKEDKIPVVEEGYVVLPFKKDDFKQFIRGLLGSPQALSKTFNGTFEKGLDEAKTALNIGG